MMRNLNLILKEVEVNEDAQPEKKDDRSANLLLCKLLDVWMDLMRLTQAQKSDFKLG